MDSASNIRTYSNASYTSQNPQQVIQLNTCPPQPPCPPSQSASQMQVACPPPAVCPSEVSNVSMPAGYQQMQQMQPTQQMQQRPQMSQNYGYSNGGQPPCGNAQCQCRYGNRNGQMNADYAALYNYINDKYGERGPMPTMANPGYGPNGEEPIMPSGKSPDLGEVASLYNVVADKVIRICQCTRRNGLQDQCPMPGCRGRAKCLTTPLPTCHPSGYYKSGPRFETQCCYNPNLTSPHEIINNAGKDTSIRCVPCPNS